MLRTIRVLVDINNQLAYAQIESPVGSATYEVDARGEDVFERVRRAVAITNRAAARRKIRDVHGTLREVTRML